MDKRRDVDDFSGDFAGFLTMVAWQKELKLYSDFKRRPRQRIFLPARFCSAQPPQLLIRQRPRKAAAMKYFANAEFSTPHTSNALSYERFVEILLKSGENLPYLVWPAQVGYSVCNRIVILQPEERREFALIEF